MTDNTNTGINPNAVHIGVIGLGLMGCSITTCLLMAGHPAVAIASIPQDMTTAEPRIRELLKNSQAEGLVTEPPDHYFARLTITEDYNSLNNCRIVMECTIEGLEIKESVYRKIESVVPEETIVTSNTSAIPISILQRQTRVPGRFLGLHWTEPSHTTRFLEIICGELSDVPKAEWLYNLSHFWDKEPTFWDKEPTLVRKDIRGFITNRLMYAM